MSSPQAGNSTVQKASWLGLPRKGQLLLLFLCRVLDFMQMATFQTICYYQLKSFTTSSISEMTLSWQTGIAIGAFTAAQVCTSVFWGVCADKKWCGRKPVLLIGLIGTALSCVASAFARSFYQMVAFRIVGGLLNGTVGIVRTMLSENVVEKRFQSRAFSLLSLSFNVASFLGPLIAGLLSNPLKVNYSLKEGSTNLLDRYPYASPLLINAGAIFLLTVVVFLYIEETAKNLRGDVFRLLRYKVLTILGVQRNSHYNALRTEDTEANDLREFSVSSPTVHSHEGKSGARGVSIWTFTFLMTLASQSIFDLHMGAYTGLWPLFLSNPRENTDNVSTSKSGGLGLPIEDVGVATSIAGAIGMFIQILIYPQINDIIGVVNSYRYFSCLFPIAYFALPLLGLIAEKATVSIWVAIFFTLMIHVTGRVFVIPATLIILNNSAASPELLGKVHGIGQMASSIFRTLGPIFAGYLFEAGLELQSIFFAWWVVGGLAVVGFGAAQYVRDGPVSSPPTQEAND